MSGVMNRMLALAAVSAVLICSCRGRQGAQPPPADAQEQVRSSVDRFGDAFLKADVDALDALLTDDYVHTNLSGTVLDKTRWLNYVKSREGEINSGKLKVDSYVNDGIVVRVYGDAAVVTGCNVTKGAREGQAFTTRLRFTQVRVKQSRRWRRAAFHDSALPDEADASHGDVPEIVRLLADDSLGSLREKIEHPLSQAHYDAFTEIDRDPDNELVVAEAGVEMSVTLPERAPLVIDSMKVARDCTRNLDDFGYVSAVRAAGDVR